MNALLHEASRAASPALDNARVLVVDDEPVNLWVAEAIVEDLGAEAVLVETLDEAVAACGESVFALVLLDLHLAGSDGYQVARALRQCGLSAPIIAVSARIDANVEAQGQEAGIDAFLEKPLEGDALTACLRQLAASEASTPSAQAEVPSSTVETFVPEQLEALFPGRKACVTAVLTTFFQQSWALLETVTQVSRAGEHLGTAATALLPQRRHNIVVQAYHTLCGSAGTVGADRLHAYAREAEAAVLASPDLGQVNLWQDRLSAALAEVGRAVQQRHPALPWFIRAIPEGLLGPAAGQTVSDSQVSHA